MACFMFDMVLFYRQSPPPEDRSLYADPKAIEHEVVPSTGDEYAMIDISNKKKKQPQAASSLYQVM